MSLDVDTSMTATPRYARFSRRVRAIVIDLMIVWAVIFSALALAIAVSSDSFSRGLGFSVIAVLLLYEPVLVSSTGSTLGHYFTNLRVVDEAGGNISFLKACARAVIKGLLSWYSFIIFTATRRNQALHDLLTRSTVQILDPSRATPSQYITERAELTAPNMPSRLRRVLVISGYLILIYLIFILVGAVLEINGALPKACVNNCSAGRKMIDLAVGVALLAVLALIIPSGWKGKLFGARRS